MNDFGQRLLVSHLVRFRASVRVGFSRQTSRPLCAVKSSRSSAGYPPLKRHGALKMGAAGGGGPGPGARVCFRGEGTDNQHAYDACLATTPDNSDNI